MVSKYGVFYIIATKGHATVSGILQELEKPKEYYNAIFNHLIELEKDGLVLRKDGVKIVHTKRSEQLFNIISFCVRNSINYDILLKKSFIDFLIKAAKKEVFTIRDIHIHPQTFKFYVDALSNYGFLLVISKNPLRVKLLRHHFIIDVVNFFKRGIMFYVPKKKDFIPYILKEMRKYRRNKRLHYSVLEGVERRKEAGFIYSSLNLEGNPITLPETQKLIFEDVLPEHQKIMHVNEVVNYKKAVDFMISNVKKRISLSMGLLLEYHRLAMGHIVGAGVLRKQNVKIKNNPSFHTSDWRDVPKKLNDLLVKYGEFISEKRGVKGVISFAAFFHNEFQRIHPFIDGNSRISRLVMLHILRSGDIPVLDLPIGYFDMYLDLTKRSSVRDDESFKYLIEEIVFINFKRVNNSFA